MQNLDPTKVAAYLGVSVDTRVEDATKAAELWVEKRRSLTDPAVLWLEDDVILGAIMYAALLYQTKSAPQGLPEYEEFQSVQYGSAMSGIYRLVGQDVVIA